MEMSNRGISVDKITVQAIAGAYLREKDVSAAISFSQHAYNQVNVR